MYWGLLQHTQQTLFSAVVLVFVLLVVLILLIILVLVLIVLLVLLVIHDDILRNVVLRFDRSVILSRNSRFILIFENQAHNQSADHGGSNSSGSCF